MIESFVDSWALFQDSYLVGWLIAVVLSIIGVLVVARDQVFLGVAVSQASTFGIALALWLEGAFAMRGLGGFNPGHVLTGGVFSVAAALVTARSGQRHRESHEATTGWVFLFAGSAAVLLVAHSPHGLEEVQRLMASTLIGASRTDVWVFGLATLVTVGALLLLERRLVLLMLDRDMAGAVGLRVTLWEACLYAWLGLLVGLSIHAAGMVYAFGCLVLPALIARTFCREVRAIFRAAPAVALAASVASFVLANHHDYPPGQVTVALLSTTLLACWLVRWVASLRR